MTCFCASIEWFSMLSLFFECNPDTTVARIYILFLEVCYSHVGHQYTRLSPMPAKCTRFYQKKCTTPFLRQAKVYESIFTSSKSVQVHFHVDQKYTGIFSQKVYNPLSCRAKVYKSIFMSIKNVQVHFHIMLSLDSICHCDTPCEESIQVHFHV